MEGIEVTNEVAKSFKQALLRSRFSENGNEKNFNYNVEEISSDEDEAALEGEEQQMDDEVARTRILKVSIPPSLLKKIREPWEKCLIARLLGKSIGYKLFMVKMTKIWGLQVDFEALDIGNGFFIVKFDMADDYNKVYIGGLWVVMDHYVTVRKWQQDFKSDKAEEDTTTIWVQFPNLPIEYYNEKVLYHIAKMLGVPLKIDINTAMAVRVKYARVYIEMNLRQPLIPYFSIGNHTYRVEYEHLHSLCFLCGRFGYQREVCSDRAIPVPGRIEQPLNRDGHQMTKAHEANGPSPREEEMTDLNSGNFGPWMMVQNQKRKNRGPMRANPVAQKSNRFAVLIEKGGKAGTKAHSGKEKGRGKVHGHVGLTSNWTKAIEKSKVSTTIEMAKKQLGEAGSLEKKGVSDRRIRDQKTEIEKCEISNLQRATNQPAVISHQAII
ncbi:uncharacterized protein LOC114288464 [Camellia sinensis]|uniref:uncharacterized protein LOC114288464 n=1 Tax=Camellia sinensis TaxID=4442 RepID=UPI0010361BB4|nr:uncharacterized protein LOC114288464 [Camellia sinensis]